MKQIGRIKGLHQFNNRIQLEFEKEKGDLTFWKEGLVHFRLDPTGAFDDQTKNKLLAKQENDFTAQYGVPKVIVEDGEAYYKVISDQVILHLYKDAFRIEAYKKDDTTCIFKEVEPITYTEDRMIQKLEGDDKEYFYGGGVQNGYFSHKNTTLDIELKISHWNKGSVSSPAPFYMSTKGYGQFRNTFTNGHYTFKEQTIIEHEEGKVDTFYCFGDDLHEILSLYTELTGRAPLIPRWGLMPGDANCYKETMDALKVAKAYEEYDIPRGWILPNDGYGCGYTDLKGFIKEAEKLGFKVGLWTENSVDKIAKEVSEFGSRVVKTDVAWVGPGYEFGLDAVKVCYEGIENNSKDRGYVWTCCGWAGSQRYAAVWSGDQFGNWEYIRMHIPTYIGAGLSGHAYCGSDIDAIFAGSAETQVRDLQWKCFTPILINMSGWAPRDKQPWVWGEPYTTYNRKYLNLKLRLTPYMYHYAYESYKTGSPIVRAMLWQYPDDPYTLTKDTQHQFMLGDSFIVAPVYEQATIRDNIYLPDANQIWIDYFTGEQYKGGRVINSFKAPLDKLPLFVKNGAIIPMYPLGRFDGDKLPNESNPLTLDLYPYGVSEFELYEDDGSTQAYKEGACATTKIQMTAPKGGEGNVVIHIDGTKGHYEGMEEVRCYEFKIHSKVSPKAIQGLEGLEKEQWVEVETKQAYETRNGNTVYFDPVEAGGVLYIKTRAYSVREAITLEVVAIHNDQPVEPLVHEVIPEIPQRLEGLKVEDSFIEIGWQEVKEASYYDLKINGILFENVSNPFLHRDLDYTSSYTYQVRARNSKGGSDWSHEVVLTTMESHLKNVLAEEQMEVYATSERPGYDASKAVNRDDNSMWLSRSEGESDLPVVYEMHFKEAYKLDKFEYQSREKGTKGNITKYNLSVSQDGRHYKTVVQAGIWPDQDAPHVVTFKEIVAKHIKIEALEGNQNYANAIHFKPYKVEGTEAVQIGDYTGGGTVDENDLTFVTNYMGVAYGDNDWDYVSKCDVNYNGRIDVYDLSLVASQLEGGLNVQEQEAKGEIALVTDVEEVQEGETFTVQVIGKGLQNVYAFEAILTLDTKRYAHKNCLGRRCKKEVIASSSALTEHMINASALKEDEITRVVVAFSNKGNGKLIDEDGVLATFNLVAKQGGKVDLSSVSTLLVGPNLRF